MPGVPVFILRPLYVEESLSNTLSGCNSRCETVSGLDTRKAWFRSS